MSPAEPQTVYDVCMGGVLQFAELFMLQAAARQTGGVAPGAEVQSGS